MECKHCKVKMTNFSIDFVMCDCADDKRHEGKPYDVAGCWPKKSHFRFTRVSWRTMKTDSNYFDVIVDSILLIAIECEPLRRSLPL